MENNKAVLFELNIENDRCIFPNTISDAIIDANKELKDLEDKLNETLETIRLLTPECDKLDYILSASSGALCGIMDVFLVGKPGESPLGDITDKWFANRTVDFAKICGYTGDKNSLSSAIKFLEKKFKIPYDQSVGGGIFRELIDLTPSNHHFKSLLPNFSCHSLRHTFTTRMCEAGVNVKIIQDTLGHKDISTTLNIYTDVTKELKKSEFAGLDAYFKSEYQKVSNT